METFIAVCLAILVLELGILVTILVLALLQIKKTAQAVEVLTFRVDQQVSRFGETMRSGWMNLFGAAANLASRHFFKN